LDVFVYSRDAAGTEALRADHDLLEQHWSYMDAFAASMIARGPTFRADRQTVTGSLHVLALPDVRAAREFVEREPNNRAGVYGEHRVWRFESFLGRTMWEFPGTSGEPRFLVIAQSRPEPAPADSLPSAMRQRLILYGALSTLDDGTPVGVALALQAPSRQAAEALVEDAGFGEEPHDIEIHDWEFGGRR
jgi:hypothetical protein